MAAPFSSSTLNEAQRFDHLNSLAVSSPAGDPKSSTSATKAWNPVYILATIDYNTREFLAFYPDTKEGKKQANNDLKEYVKSVETHGVNSATRRLLHVICIPCGTLKGLSHAVETRIYPTLEACVE